MAYEFQCWITKNGPDLETMGSHLRKHLPETCEVEVKSDCLFVRHGEWALRGTLNTKSYLREEAEEFAKYMESIDAFTAEQRAKLKESSRRVEFEPAHPQMDTDDYYNTWLLTAERLAELAGVLVYIPSDGTTMG